MLAAFVGAASTLDAPGAARWGVAMPDPFDYPRGIALFENVGKFDSLRDAHLPAVSVPMLFVQGTRDVFARPDLLAAVLGRLGERATLHSIDGGDHSLSMPRRAGRAPAQVEAEVAGAISRWLAARGW